MAERLTHYITEGDFVSNIPHPFNTVLHQKPHLEPWFLKTVELYESGRFSAIEEAPVLANIAFIENPANLSLVAEGYRVEPPTVTNWVRSVYDKPHLVGVIEEACYGRDIRQNLTEGTNAFQQQAFTEYFESTIDTIPLDLLTDIERWIVEDAEKGMTNEEMMKKYNYSMKQGIVKVLNRARKKIEDQVFATAGIVRSTKVDFVTVQGKDHTHSPIASAVQNGRLPGQKFLRMWYTHQKYVDTYIAERARIPDPDLLSQGYVLVCDHLDPDSPEYSDLVKKGKYDHVLVKTNLVYIKQDDLNSYLIGKLPHVSRTSPGAGYFPLSSFAKTESGKKELRKKAESGEIAAVRHTNNYWYTTAEEMKGHG